MYIVHHTYLSVVCMFTHLRSPNLPVFYLYRGIYSFTHVSTLRCNVFVCVCAVYMYTYLYVFVDVEVSVGVLRRQWKLIDLVYVQFQTSRFLQSGWSFLWSTSHFILYTFYFLPVLIFFWGEKWERQIEFLFIAIHARNQNQS